MTPPRRPLLIVITGATASGKTSLAIAVAQMLGCEIISADSRQMYAGIPIGTASPSVEELSAVRHHLIGQLSLDDYYSAARFESDALDILQGIFDRSGGYAVVCGGSMMYVDALVRGIDRMPTISETTRGKLSRFHDEQGSEALLALLQIMDPDYYAVVDRSNIKRVIHALEITMEAQAPYSTLRTGQTAERPFDILKVAIELPRAELFDRINARVDSMIEAGLIDEARKVYLHRGYNSLNTVGYKELFQYFDGTMDLETAIARIKKNTRVYAKKQLTWLKRDSTVIKVHPSTALEEIRKLITNHNESDRNQNPASH